MKIGAVTAQPNFGIYLRTVPTTYGRCEIGRYRGKNISVYIDTRRNNKMHYISDDSNNWTKIKYTYFHNGEKKVVRRENEKLASPESKVSEELSSRI